MGLKGWLLLVAACVLLVPGCSAAKAPKVLVLGFDGMDPILLQQFMDEGVMPNFVELAQRGGGVSKLATTNPPQSPVAWSTFITGVDPATHGVFDFVHRDAKRLEVIPSLAESHGDHYQMAREGVPFWRYLENAGIPARLVKIPASFPAVEPSGTYLTDMGTPDLEGSYGTYSFYTDEPPPATPPERTGGRRLTVEVREGAVRGSLVGPSKAQGGNESLPFEVLLDPKAGAALFRSGDQQALLKPGEWSEWLPVRFSSTNGMVRLYLKSLDPHFALYVTPINIDPLNPVIPISSPARYAMQLAEECGCFYTQGLPEETDALLDGVFTDEDFLLQSSLVVKEREALLERELAHFEQGFLFFYLSSTDIMSHLYWNTIDSTHPGYDPERAKKCKEVIKDSYKLADRLLGAAVHASGPETTVIALSDHGFAPFYRSVALNLWLRKNGYQKGEGKSLQGVDWSQTQAYAVGFNSIYLNLQGREAQGAVAPAEREKLLERLSRDLQTFRDPASGESVVATVQSLPLPTEAALAARSPDILVGYRRGYRASWETALGGAGPQLVADNLQAWSGDHLMSPDQVPGVLASNRALAPGATPHLRDLAPSILGLYGLSPDPGWRGVPLWKR